MHTESVSLQEYIDCLPSLQTFRWTGEVTEMVGMLIESRGPAAAVGNFCEIASADGRRIRTQVAGFRDGRVI